MSQSGPLSPSSRTSATSPSGRSPNLRRAFRRNAAACERCRKRKQKCDGVHPTCGPCSAAGLYCVPSERLAVHAECAALREQVQQLEAHIRALQSGSPPTDLHLSIPGEQSYPGPQPPEQPATSPEWGYHGRILRPTFTDRHATGADNLGSASNFRSSPWQLWSHDPGTESSPGLIDPTKLPIAEYGDALVETFFVHRWPQLPILHKPTFLELDYIPIKNGGAGRELSAFQVYMVFAIASAQSGSSSASVRYSHKNFFDLAVRDLNVVLAADDLDCIQCLLLLCLYGANEPQSVNMWYTVGLALRIALGIDLHRQETTSNVSDVVAAEMSKRLFWSVYVMDRSMSMAMGRPLGIQNADITASLPLQITDERLSQPDVVPALIPETTDTSTFIHVIKLRRINAEIYDTFHTASGRSHLDYESLDSIRQKHYADLNAWLDTAPRYGPAATAMLQTTEWFQIAYHHAILTLYRPSHVFPISSLAGLRFCVDSAISLVTCYGALYAKNKITYTFIALNSLFMAAVTMLHSLRASHVVRGEMSRSVAQENIQTCARLLRGLSGGRPVGERCAMIVERLGNATLAMFDQAVGLDNEVDQEFMSWFGLKLQQSGNDSLLEGAQPTPSVDIPWNDFLSYTYNVNNSSYIDLIL